MNVEEWTPKRERRHECIFRMTGVRPVGGGGVAPLRTVPVTDVSDAATGSLQLVGAGKSKVRLFLERGDTWTYVTAGTRVTAAELRAGLRLGLDGRDVIRQAGDGRITVTDGDRTSTGNLETIPPYAHNGKSYPAGRIITGRHGSRLPGR